MGGDRDASGDGVSSGDVITAELVHAIRNRFALDWRGMHGVSRWIRVCENGLRLATTTGAAPAVVELFAFLHDARRGHDGRDSDQIGWPHARSTHRRRR